MKTRVLSILLACLMVFSLLPALFLVSSAEDLAFSSSFYEEAQAGKITYETAGNTVTYGGDWQVITLGYTGGKFSPVLLDRVNPKGDKEQGGNYWAVTEGAYSGIEKNGWSQWWWGSLPSSGVMSLDTYEIGFPNTQGIQAYMYTVPGNEDVLISATIDNFTAPAEGYGYYFSIMVDEQMIWPTYGGSYSYAAASREFFEDTTGCWYHVTSTTTIEELNAALADMSAIVAGGSRVEFCYRYAGAAEAAKLMQTRAAAMPKLSGKLAGPEDTVYYFAAREGDNTVASQKIDGGTVTLPSYTGDAIFLGWDLNGDGLVDAQPGSTITALEYAVGVMVYADAVVVGTSSFKENLPALDDEQKAIFRNGWEIGVFSVSQNAFLPFNAPADKYGIITVEGSVWGGQGGGLYTAIGQIAFSGCTEDKDYRNQINYTAAYNGDISLDFNQVRLSRESAKNPNYISYSMSVYVNGEKVWPTDADYKTFTSPESYTVATAHYEALDDVRAAGFPLSLSVKKGDVISVRTMQGNADNWMAHIDPVVAYTKLDETPIAAGSSITIGSDLSLHMLVQVAGKKETSEVGLEYWLEKPTEAQIAAGGTQLTGELDENTGLYRFTYAGLSAKQMADNVYARPYTKNGEDISYGSLATFSIKAYAEKAYGHSEKLDKLLAALLTYGANAQTMFDYHTENFANDFMREEDRPAAFEGELNNVYANGEGAGKIKSVSLLLDCELGFKFMIDSVEGATAYELEVADNADFTDSEKIPMTAVWEGREQKAIVKIGYGELGRTFYVRAVIDGEAGPTLTYNLDSYFNRIQMKCDDGLYYTLSALLAFDRALQDYRA